MVGGDDYHWKGLSPYKNCEICKNQIAYMVHDAMKTEFIIHADDFGHSPEVNACIDECFQRGWISETSLMVNMPGFDSAVKFASRETNCGMTGYKHLVGLHLNLTEGQPLTERLKHCPRFCSSDGHFNKVFHRSLNGRFFLSHIEQLAVEEEIEAQIQKFIKIGGVMMRIDSHHHVHTDWSIYRLLKPLAIKYGFLSMRISADLHASGIVKKIYKSFFNRTVRRQFRTTEHFDNVENCVVSPFGETIEVMVHPLQHEGRICDEKVPMQERVVRLETCPSCSIRRWNHV